MEILAEENLGSLALWPRSETSSNRAFSTPPHNTNTPSAVSAFILSTLTVISFRQSESVSN